MAGSDLWLAGILDFNGSIIGLAGVFSWNANFELMVRQEKGLWLTKVIVSERSLVGRVLWLAGVLARSGIQYYWGFFWLTREFGCRGFKLAGVCDWQRSLAGREL